MYKDVWKKFGVKALIVLCSVLLVGGVAIAAPRLRAAPLYDMNDLTFDTQELEYQVDPAKLKDLQDGSRDPSEGIGLDQYPTTITAKLPGGGTKQFAENKDYFVQNKKTLSNASEKVETIDIVAFQGTNSEITGSAIKTVSFKIVKSTEQVARYIKADYTNDRFEKITGTKPTGNSWVVDASETPFSVSDWDIYIQHDTLGKIPLTAGVDYDSSKMPGTTKIGGSAYSATLSLDNYIDTKEITASVYKYIGGNEIDVEVDDTQTNVHDKVAVYDLKGLDTGGKDKLSWNVHYYGQVDPKSPTRYKIEGNTDKYYVGTRTATLSGEASNFNPRYDSYTCYYDETNTIENRPSVVTDENGNALTYGTDYIIENYRFADGGPTAGLVEFDIVGQGAYKGTSKGQYRLMRKLSFDEGINPSLDIKLTPETPGDTFEYDTKWHAMIPDISFAGVSLEKGTDYDVRYVLEKFSDGSKLETSDRTKLIDAGAVSIVIEGKGYYEGTIRGSNTDARLLYNIKQKNVADGSRQLVLRQGMQENNVFELTSDIKDRIFDSAYLELKPNTTSQRQHVKDIVGRNYFFTYDEAGENKIEDADWGKLQPGINYYLQVEFTGNYSGTLPAEFKVQEYQAQYINVVFADCPECGAKNGEPHTYTGEPHEPAILKVTYKNNPDPIPPSVYEGKVKYENNTNKGTASVTLPVSSKLEVKVTFEIKQLDLTDGSIKLSAKDGFINGQHDYTGYTKLPDITELILETTNGQSITLKPEDYQVTKLFVKDASGNVSGPVTPDKIVADETTTYCFGVERKGDNLTIGGGVSQYAYTETFTFIPRSIKAEGEKGIHFKITPKKELGSSNAEYIQHIQQNLIITDKKLNEEVRAKDYRIDPASIDDSAMDQYSVIKFSVIGQNCYKDTKTDIMLYVGKNITLAKIKEFKNSEVPVIQDPILPGDDESFSAALTMQENCGNINDFQNDFYSDGDAAGDANSNTKITVNYYDSSSQKLPTALKKGQSGQPAGNYWISIKNADPEPDDPDDTTGKRYATVVITGKSGYYGTITLKVPIKKTKLDDYKIVFRNDTYVSDDNVYTGEPVTPEFDVVHKVTGAILVKDQDYVVDKWDNNTNANSGSTGLNNKASVTISGIYAFEGTLTETFTIFKRKIGIEKRVELPDGTDAGTHLVLNQDEGFRLEGWKNNKSYDYTPFTRFEGETPDEKAGVIPKLKLYYKDELLVENKDYKMTPVNHLSARCYSDQDTTYDNLPKVVFSTNITDQNSNFTGGFEDTFEIAPINLADSKKCLITLGYTETAFTGYEKEPKVTVYLYRDGDEEPFEVPNDEKNPEYTVKYTDNIFVSVGGSASGTGVLNTTRVTITGTGNFQKFVTKPFLIYGEFDPKGAGGKDNSEWDISEKTLAYKVDATSDYLNGACDVTYSEKLAVDGDYDDPKEIKGKRYPLGEKEYRVIGANRIGTNLDARVESAIEYFKGGRDFKMTIQGDLAASYVKYEVQPIGYSGSSTVELNKFLDVTYDTANGKQSLSYDTDYVFESEPTAKLGKNEVNIIPKKDVSDKYLIGKKTITYYVTTGLDALVLENVEPSYPYAHGQPVLKPEDIIVKLGNDRLKLGVDYNIEIIGDATSVGTHTIVVTSANEEKFSGKKEQSFTITKYNLDDAVKDKLITVHYIDDEKNPYYTGGVVVPTVTSVTIATSTGSLYVLENGSGDKPAEYEVVAGSQGDHVNWTSGDVKPDFILSGRGNYTGEITFEYSIKRKDISDASEVTIAPIDDIYYDNGRDITPVPSIQYKGRDLSGIRHSGNAGDYVDWKDYTKHFTYQYSTKIDLKSVGTKEITVRGIGNFTGETTVTYKVIPLNIKDAELVFSGDTPVYDSKPQTPAFKLIHSGDVILEWTGKQVISNFIASADVVFGNNINATGEEPATVRISITGEKDNYEGVKETTFTILPAPLNSHTKFLYRPVGSNENKDLKNYKLNLDFIGVGSTVKPVYAQAEGDLEEGQLGIYYDFAQMANHGAFLKADEDYTIEYKYVEPDTDDVDVREDYQDPDISFAGKVKVTITGKGNYADTACFWYYIGKDISSDATISMKPTTTVFNSQVQAPEITVSGIDGLKYVIAKYKHEVAVENLIDDSGFVNADNYYIRIEGDPREGTYATKPYTLTYTITPRAFSNNLVIDGFKREYSYTGYDICPVGISVTDYIGKIKYKLTEDVDYTLTYTNNLNAGTAYINIKGQNNFSGSATANFMITSSTISSGGWGGNNSFLDQGTGEISGSTAVSPNEVNMSMDTIDAMYYTGKPVYPKVSIAGMTENIDYTVTFSNNVEVGTAVATVNGIGNNKGTITKNFRIIAQLSKCTISPIPAQQYTGSEVKPALTVKCGNSILMEGTDYTVTYSNNINIGTATATLRALNNANYTGTASVKFSIGNDVGGFIISGYAPSYAYTGKAITPGVVVETGSRTLVPGTEYTVSYSNNVNAGTATITVTGVGKYSGKQTANFVIEPKNIQSCDTTDISDRTYTGDAYTPSVTVSDGGKVLTKGVDYTVTYTNNTNPGTATVVIRGLSSNYAGTKVISFKILAVAVKGLKATNVKYNSMKLKWTKQGYADGYQLCDSKSKVIKTLTKNSVTITGLTAGKTYKYKVRSYIRNADGTKSYGAFSSVLNATTKLRTPTVKVVSNAKGQARISWSKVSGASGYEIYYKKTSSAKYKKLKTVNSPNIRVCTVRGMKSGDRAYFRIRAFRKNGSKKVYSSLNPLKVITVK